nr:1462_t:CDS:1 [Entrophospora candida]
MEEEQKTNKFREILGKSQNFKDFSMFRNISKRFLQDHRDFEGLCLFDKYSAKNASHDVDIIKAIHQEWRGHQQETDKGIRFIFSVLLRHLKGNAKLCYLYFLMIDYVFGYINLSEKDNENVVIRGKVNYSTNDGFIEIDIELVIMRLINLFNALEEGDFKEQKNDGIFFALIMICNKIVNFEKLQLMKDYVEIKKDKTNKFKISRIHLNAMRINFMFYLGIIRMEHQSSQIHSGPYDIFLNFIDYSFSSSHPYQSEINKLQNEFSEEQFRLAKESQEQNDDL